MYSYTLSLTSALDGVGGQCHTLAALPPGKSRYPLYGRLGQPQGRSGRAWKIPPPTGIQSPDRPGRSESLYRLRYPRRTLEWCANTKNEEKMFLSLVLRSGSTGTRIQSSATSNKPKCITFGEFLVLLDKSVLFCYVSL